MANYRNIQGKLQPIKEKPFKLEREIQKLTEENLNLVLGFSLVKSEFSLSNFRIDTLAFDPNANSFVIIEYKRDKNFSVVDQGYAYLSLMLNNKADFILEYNECCNKTLKKDGVDWSQSKVIFVSPSFTTYQREAINFKDLPIELWEVKQYDDNTIIYNQIKSAGAKESIKSISRNDEIVETVNKEIKVYTEQEHLEVASPEIQELYETYRNAIANLVGIEIKPTKKYIAFAAGSNIVDIHIQKKALKMWINLFKGELDDPKGLARDVANIGHWGNGDYEIQVSSDEDLDYIFSLIWQSHKKNRK